MFRKTIVTVGVVAMAALIGCDGVAVETNQDQSSEILLSPLTHYIAAEAAPGDGFVVKEVNEKFSQCASYDKGSLYCFVDELDFRYADIDPDLIPEFEYQFRQGRALVQGWMTRVQGDRTVVDVLYVLDAWYSVNNIRAEDTTIYNVSAVDLQCVRAPCPTHIADVVNGETSVYLDHVLLDNADPRDVNLGKALMRGEGLLVAGDIFDVTTNGTKRIPTIGTKTLVSKTFYLPVTTGDY